MSTHKNWFRSFGLLLIACASLVGCASDDPCNLCSPGIDAGQNTPDAGVSVDSGAMADTSAPDGDLPDAGSAPDSDGLADADDSSDADAATRPRRFSVAPTDKTTSTFHTVDIEGSAGAVIGGVSIVDSVGTVEVHGRRLDAFAYRQIPWPSENRTLYQTLVVAPDALYVVWFYCSSSDELREIWFEGTDGTRLDYERASGRCVGAQQSDRASVSFPALDMELDEVVGGFRVDGTGVSIGADGTGRTTFFEKTYETFVFDQVDCTVQCNTTDGWYELHALMWHAEDAELYFGIFYLLDDGATVRLSYAIGLPSLFEPGQQQYPDATWTKM